MPRATYFLLNSHAYYAYFGAYIHSELKRNVLAYLVLVCCLKTCSKLFDVIDFAYLSTVVERVEISQKKFARFFGPRMFVRS